MVGTEHVICAIERRYEIKGYRDAFGKCLCMKISINKEDAEEICGLTHCMIEKLLYYKRIIFYIIMWVLCHCVSGIASKFAGTKDTKLFEKWNYIPIKLNYIKLLAFLRLTMEPSKCYTKKMQREKMNLSWEKTFRNRLFNSLLHSKYLTFNSRSLFHELTQRLQNCVQHGDLLMFYYKKAFN